MEARVKVHDPKFLYHIVWKEQVELLFQANGKTKGFASKRKAPCTRFSLLMFPL